MISSCLATYSQSGTKEAREGRESNPYILLDLSLFHIDGLPVGCINQSISLNSIDINRMVHIDEGLGVHGKI